MNLSETLKKLCRIEEPEGTIVTVAWDVSKKGDATGATRKTLERALLRQLKGGDPAKVKKLEPAIRKILRYAENDLGPAAKGLFLVAGPGTWTPIELGVPLGKFIHQGETAYVPPLLEAMARFPRAIVVRYDHREAILEEVELGEWTPAGRLVSSGVERDPEHLATGREGAVRTGGGWMRGGMGGGGRDRFERHFEEDAETLLHRTAAQVVALERKAGPAAILAFGDRKHFAFFRDALSSELRPRVVHVGPGHRDEESLRKAAQEEVERLAREDARRSIAGFRERQAEGCHVAMGAAELLPALEQGTVTRVVLDVAQPNPGGKCPACGVFYPKPEHRCSSCSVKLAERSLTQEVATRAILHPPLAITFAPAPSRAWLRDLGGVAALLSTKGVRSKR